MPIFSKEAYAGNYKYNRLVKEEAKIINEQLANKNHEFVMNLMLGNNKFEVNGEKYEFKALKFNAGKTSSGLHMLASNLTKDLYELSRVVPLDFDDITNVPLKAMGFSYGDDLNYHKLQGDALTQEELDEQIAQTYPATKEGHKEIEIQDLKDKKREYELESRNKNSQRNNISFDEIKDFNDLKEKYGISSTDILNENEKEEYRDYLSARDKYDKEEKDLIEKYKQERQEIHDKHIEDRRKEVASWTKEDYLNSLKSGVEAGQWAEFDNKFGNLDKEEKLELKKAGFSAYDEKKNPEAYNLIEKAVKGWETSKKDGLESEERFYNIGFEKETKEGIDQIKEQIREKRLNDPEYVKGLEQAEKLGIDKYYVSMAARTIKAAQNNYKAMSGAGRFFSYLNPFQNKYRTARNEIKANIKELAETTSVNKKELSNYIYGKTEQMPTCNDKKFSDISEEYLSVKNNEIDKEIQYVQSGKELSKAEFEKKLENDLESKNKEAVSVNEKDANSLEKGKEMEQTNTL
ncbi:MAG: hypothetical protein MJ082_01970 [Clostridia bacterium]|nr:hypothetical protein [Clostridia bacterium]